MRFLVHMGAHRFVVEGDTPDDAEEQLEGRLMMMGLDRTGDVMFEALSTELERPAA